MTDLEEKIHDLSLAIAGVWKDPRLLYSSSTTLPKVVVTRANEGAPILPKTSRPIRGSDRVNVDVLEGKLEGEKLAEWWVERALLEPWGYGGSDPEVQAARVPIRTSIEEVFAVFREMDGLPELLFESFGFKHYEPDEVRERAQQRSEDGERVFWRLVLASSFGRALHELGFDPSKKEEFGRWFEVAGLVARDFEILAARKRNAYQAIIGLNSPLIDERGELPIVSLKLGDEPITIQISGATDEDLTRLLRTGSGIPVDQINTLISYRFSADVAAPVDEYLYHYQQAALVAERITDILRLLCEDDVGVLSLEIRRAGWATPAIRKTYERFYQHDLAPYLPKRFRFGPATEQTMTGEQIETLRRLLPPYLCDVLDVKGLNSAMRRFRASFDRYESSDPERLLEMAIALEAILLNDAGDRQELSYRLRLRAARFLAEDTAEREQIFQLLGDLYGFRSRIAHGDTLQDLKPKDQARLDAILQETPRILRRLLLKVMEDEGLRGLTKEQLKLWWRKVELG